MRNLSKDEKVLRESGQMSELHNDAPEDDKAEFNEAEFKKDLTELIPHLRAFSRSLCGNATLADDVAQDALLKAWNARSWRATSLEPEVAEQTIVANSDAEQSMHLNDLRLTPNNLCT